MWEPGELHDTAAECGLTGLVLEGPDLAEGARWSRTPRAELAPWVWWSGDRTPFWPLMQEADEDAEHLASYWTRGHLLTRCDVEGHPVVEALWDRGEEGPELMSLAVDRNWRHAGLGREAVALVRAEVAAAGLPRLLAATTPAGVGFYLRLGFRLWAVRRDVFRPLADVREDGVLMRDQIVLEIPAQPPMTNE
jgi:GNAT superfamily N-acetyltransferase